MAPSASTGRRRRALRGQPGRRILWRGCWTQIPLTVGLRRAVRTRGARHRGSPTGPCGPRSGETRSGESGSCDAGASSQCDREGEKRRILLGAVQCVTTVSPTHGSPTPTAWSGSLNATDPDSPTLKYSVTSAPPPTERLRSPETAATPTPDAAYAATGTTDSFGLGVSDDVGGFHLHGLVGLLSLFTFDRRWQGARGRGHHHG